MLRTTCSRLCSGLLDLNFAKNGSSNEDSRDGMYEGEGTSRMITTYYPSVSFGEWFATICAYSWDFTFANALFWRNRSLHLDHFDNAIFDLLNFALEFDCFSIDELSAHRTRYTQFLCPFRVEFSAYARSNNYISKCGRSLRCSGARIRKSWKLLIETFWHMMRAFIGVDLMNGQLDYQNGH